MTWIYYSKNGEDEYVNMFAKGSGGVPVADFDYAASRDPIVIRGILKHKLMKQCWTDGRDFYYMDSGYFGNNPNPQNPQGWKLWHRIVKNDLQHGEIVARPGDRWQRMGITLQPRRYGRKIVVAVPDAKPCKFYDIDLKAWTEETVSTIKQHTDRPIIVRQRAANRIDRIATDPLAQMLADDVHALVTFNSNAATESILLGVPVFTLAPSAAAPVGLQDLSQIENPRYPNQDELYAWASSLAYNQFHVEEMKNGSALQIIQGMS